MHQRAMILFRKAQYSDITQYNKEHVPIVKALANLDAATASRLKKKFELVYFLSKENLSLSKMSTLCTLA